MGYLLHTDKKTGKVNQVAGYVGVVGPENNPNYFTGCGYAATIDEAKVFRTARGCKSAMKHWQEADYACKPLSEKWWETRRASPVKLSLLKEE